MSTLGVKIAADGINHATRGQSAGSVVGGVIDGVMDLGDSIASTFLKVKKAVEKAGNKAKFKAVYQEYTKLTEGKVDTIQKFKNKNNTAEATYVDTDMGVFMRGKSVKEDIYGDSRRVCYTGIAKVKDEKGQEVLAYFDNVELLTYISYQSTQKDYTLNYAVRGSILTQNGELISLSKHEATSAPVMSPSLKEIDPKILAELPKDKFFEYFKTAEEAFNQALETMKNKEKNNGEGFES